MGYGILGAILALFIIWIISIWHRLKGMSENVSRAMKQICVQMDSCFEALNKLLNLVRTSENQELGKSVVLTTVEGNAVAEISTPEELKNREEAVSEVLREVSAATNLHPELKTREDYLRYKNAVDSYGKMMHTSCLIYNDNVNKLNRELRTFPTFLIAGILGFRQKSCLEIEERKQDR